MGNLKFKISAGFWLFIVVAAVFRQGYLAAMYTVAVVLHETAHYIVAKKLLYRCNEIRVGIFGAVLYGEFQDVRGADRIKIALAGPLCNFAMCLLCLALWWLFPDAYYFTDAFLTSNLSMACVNLLPCYPLDGGRVLTGLLENRYHGNALKLTSLFTYVVSLALFTVFLLSLYTGHNLFNVGLFALGIFSGVFTKSGGECYVRTTLTHNRRRFAKKGMEKKTLVFDGDSLLRDVAKRMQGNFLYCLEVVDGDMNVTSRYNVAQLETLVVDYPLDTPLKRLPKC